MRSSMNMMIVSALLCVGALAMGLTVYINLHKFDEAFRDTVNERFYFAMEEARDIVEGEIRLGQSIDKLSNAEKSLEDLKAIDPFIVSAEIFDLEGRTVYSTDNSFLFDFVPDQWEEAWRQSESQHWNIISDDQIILGVGLTDMFNEPAGSIVLIYEEALQHQALGTVKNDLIQAAIGVSIILLVLLTIVVVTLTRPLKARLKNMDQDLKSGAALVEGSDVFLNSYQKAMDDLDDAENQLRKMEEV